MGVHVFLDGDRFSLWQSHLETASIGHIERLLVYSCDLLSDPIELPKPDLKKYLFLISLFIMT